MRSFFLIALTLIILSCSKKPEKQIVGSWQVEKIEVSTNGGPFMEEALGCSVDNIWMFEKGGHYEIAEGIDLCGGSATTGTWSLDESGTIITYTYDGYVGNYPATIVELTKQTLVTEHDPGFTTPTVYRYSFSSF